MSRYTRDSRDRVLDAVDMLALVSQRVELRRAGVDSYFGLCPFHQERTGSFHVRPDEKHYHCFGCQSSGDPFTFVMETEGLDFKGALETLADRFGVKLETEDEDPQAARRRERRERLYAVLDRAATYYARYLWEAAEAAPARKYLLERGLGEEVLREFRVGYAPSQWDRLLRASRSAHLSEEELLAAGLLQRSRTRQGQLYDRFRERIMFPSADARGRVRGFGARAMREDQRPKYLNTSENDVYHKRSQLFGIDRARAAAAKAGRMILVEGYTDVLALQQAGLRNSVGIMGTALTDEQVRELERVVSVLELCLDADRAGQEAMLRAAELVADTGRLELRVVPLPEGLDPAELVEREGADALRARVESSAPFSVFHVQQILEQADLGSAEGRDRALDQLRPVLSSLPVSIVRDDLMRRVAGRLELSEPRLLTLLAAPGGGHGEGGAGPTRPTGAGPIPEAPEVGAPAARSASRPATAFDRALKAERAFLALCVALPEAGHERLVSLNIDGLLSSELLRRVARHLATPGATEAPLSNLPEDDEELVRMVARLVEQAGRLPDVSPARLEHAHLVLERARLERAIARARAEGRPTISELARERERVLAAIHQVVIKLEQAV